MNRDSTVASYVLQADLDCLLPQNLAAQALQHGYAVIGPPSLESNLGAKVAAPLQKHADNAATQKPKGARGGGCSSGNCSKYKKKARSIEKYARLAATNLGERSSPRAVCPSSDEKRD